ncbi:hypothetical protein [uncultured Clostridium sp.]|uniref:hypothetical protein n=1 Tax=uncultured Clostridium sp. TaxID=59620 RepID=UPI0025E9C562|nr:hypothetical protein [uncultured Clostridium sp.]
MGLFKKKNTYKKTETAVNNNRVRIIMTRASVCMADEYNAPHKAVIGIDADGSLRDFINILIERYCPRIKGGIAIWALSYNDKPLAVFNGGTGTINILNDNTAKLPIEKIVKGNSSPSMFLHYIGQSTIEETAKTILQRG